MTANVGRVGCRIVNATSRSKVSRPAGLLCLIAVLASTAFPQPAELADFSIEQLLRLEVVSVSRKEQPLSKTAAAIYVLTADDIRRSGALNIPDALRMVPGLQIGRIDTTTWAVASRGFNAEYSNKLLVMVDGRSVYTPIFGGVFWNAIDVPLADIDRIEVIRGPGGTMWGANAMNGVINILTKSSRETAGTLVVAGGGTQDNAHTYIRHGARLSDSLSYRVFGKFLDVRALNPDLTGHLDDPWLQGRTGFRVDARLPGSWDLLVEGDAYRGSAGQVIGQATPNPPFSRLADNPIRQSGGFLLARLTSKSSQSSQSSLQIFLDNQETETPLLRPVATTLDIEYQRRSARGRHDIVWGADARVARSRFSTRNGGSSLAKSRDKGLLSGFLQDEISFSDNLQLIVGAKLEHDSTSHGNQLQPSVRLNWSATSKSSLWASVSRAVRSPHRLERELEIDYAYSAAPNGVPIVARLNGNQNLGFEKVTAYEVGLRSRPIRSLTIDLAGFFNRYSGLATVASHPPGYDPSIGMVLVPLSFTNGAAGSSRGLELSLTWVPKTWLRLQNNWSRLQLDIQQSGTAFSKATTYLSGTYPDYQNNTRVSLNLPRRVELDVSMYGASGLAAFGIPRSIRVDSRLSWKYSPRLEFSLTGQDLNKPSHPEFFAEGYTQSFIPRRRIFGQVQWSF